MSRIVAGSAGGRRLRVPEGGVTRPTADRVREAFFSVLASWNGTAERAVDSQLEGLGFLDLYAGSGAMGLEAASRGAGPVVLVDSGPRAITAIEANIASTGLSATLRRSRVEALVSQPNPADPFDVVWLDPPYDLATAKLDLVLADLVAQRWVRADGVMVTERSGRDLAPSLGGAETWTRRYGETTLHWFAPLNPAADESNSTPQEDQ